MTLPGDVAPVRVQMTRRAGGWRHEHPTAVIVARPTRWGNPFPVSRYGQDQAVRMFRTWVATRNSHTTGHRLLDTEDADDRFDWLLGHLQDLTGRDLACW
ncbi:DUF4326 domain-containing protein [Cellulomonas hominis]|uniref:DUF4326 domain-containing protein n=1 Tax=Cellulomonas hominis TaxID=156981 RepID=UPI001B96116B|nr:DUF4326 domain-containing protein [Cellulomonas hominis]VTR77234.1 hypothetical protein CHMI_02004 [Cellulomonas hominis]